MSNKIQKPFIKWVGGKTQLLDNIIKKIPKEMNNYFETFLGGGAVLFAVLSLKKQGNIKVNGQIYATDVNSSLINLYRKIQSSHEELFKVIQGFIKEYDSIKVFKGSKKPVDKVEAMTSKESYYYWLRDKYNTEDKCSILSAALFIIINKLCFRGMYREGPNGFNVPFGHYKKTPTVITKDEIDNISNLIQEVTFIDCSFEDIFELINTESDFVYLDPPYAPENETSFVGYVADGFSKEMHENLFRKTKELDEKGVRFMMSNANVDMVTNAFQEFQIEKIVARRAINSKDPSATTKELIVYN
tara:strand:- start:258 stop:1163 length:906 start_codon:yes stop_codon:yes gene_type:complete